MPLDVLGRTRATLTEPTSSSPWLEGLGNLVKLCCARDRALQLLLFNKECLVSALRPSDWLGEVGNNYSKPESLLNLVI
ncbi:hypothetical protein P153DRAFT_380150 [Dothidotthia symphoricarpi CBS 119687]|uniref:Uncharacterized protein n=1 Tax=Dothidotthia symphoricarpi CBS 119687 TaxID=1392245 RepID=A0A6A5ZWA5_9PLEO|nr:hypothetical protein P153DRAFT_380150 [Dothidotthia symphoricarpi CBS 119687]